MNDKKIKITKMNGCGNDFVFLDMEEFQKANLPIDVFVKKVCNRHTGIGADGVIIPDIENTDDADIKWHYYNSDGTKAQMCGNGMRCFAKYVTDNGLVSKKTFTVKTDAGIITPTMNDDGTVTVNMGKPVLEPKKIPFNALNNLNQKILVKNREFVVNAVSMGNPHCIIYTEEDDLMTLAKTYGKSIEYSSMFPEKTNVEFVKVKSRQEVDVGVWERGCGITLACGTGACAVSVASILNNLTDSNVKVNLPGGTLNVKWQGNIDDTEYNVFMTGTCEYSFFAEYLL